MIVSPTPEGLRQETPRRIGDLLRDMEMEVRPGRAAELEATSITSRSEEVRPGTLFVALPGTSADGHTFIADAARRGAAAILVERDVGGAFDVPLIRVSDARKALARLAARWYGRPAAELELVGITGTAGKTSTLCLFEAALIAAGTRVGSVGSLGINLDGRTLDRSSYTTPDPLLLHRELARLRDGGAELVAMEATSHALAQRRIHGLTFRMGIFTNLLPLEHSDYHPDFDDYVRSKTLFFEHLEPGAPLIYNRDDPVTRVLIPYWRLNGISVGTSNRSMVHLADTVTTATGTRYSIRVSSPLPRLAGGTVGPVDLDVRLQLLGPANRMNASLAAVAALCAGAEPREVKDALARFRPPHRRLQVIYRGRFTLLDDTVGHPDSISAFFDVVARLRPRHVHLVWAVRGQRGEEINRQNGETLAIWAERLKLETLVVTRSDGTADELNRVDDEEYEAALEPLQRAGLEVREVPRLEPAVLAALERASDGDLVALLGAQGMDSGQEIALDWLAARGEVERSGEATNATAP